MRRSQKGIPQLGEVHPARRPLLSANQDATPAASSPLRRQNPREEIRDGGLCNDFVTAADSTVYATDTELGRIIRLKPGATAPDVWASDPGLVGSDGITFAGGKLYFNNVRKNLLQRIEINADGSSGRRPRCNSPRSYPDQTVCGSDRERFC
jgi:hypothetical protein